MIGGTATNPGEGVGRYISEHVHFVLIGFRTQFGIRVICVCKSSKVPRSDVLLWCWCDGHKHGQMRGKVARHHSEEEEIEYANVSCGGGRVQVAMINFMVIYPS